MILSFDVNKSANFVFAYLADVKKFVSVHPVITKMKPLGQNRFLVFETLPVASIPFHFTYPATIESNFKDRRVIMIATIMKVATISMVFTIQELNGYASIHEEISFKSILPLQSTMYRLLAKQHGLLFQNIEKSTG